VFKILIFKLAALERFLIEQFSYSKLKQQGHEVIGVHSRNWDSKDENGVCQADADYDSARRVAEHLKIELVGINCVKEYWTEVFEPFLESTQNANSFNIDQESSFFFLLKLCQILSFLTGFNAVPSNITLSLKHVKCHVSNLRITVSSLIR